MNLVIIGSGRGLLLTWHQAISWTSGHQWVGLVHWSLLFQGGTCWVTIIRPWHEATLIISVISVESILGLAEGFTPNGCQAVAWANDDSVVDKVSLYLVQVRVFHLVGVKPLPEPVLICCKMGLCTQFGIFLSKILLKTLKRKVAFRVLSVRYWSFLWSVEESVLQFCLRLIYL